LVENIKTVTLFDDYGDIEEFGLTRIDDTHYVTAKIEIPKRLFQMKAGNSDHFSTLDFDSEKTSWPIKLKYTPIS
jgi:hypothetical protein